MNFWIFKWNPDDYDLDGRLKDPDPNTSSKVTKYQNEIALGDIAFIWQTGNDRGIRAVMRIDKAPGNWPELEVEKRYAKEPESDDCLRVVGTLIRRSVHLRQPEIEAEIEKAGAGRFSLLTAVRQGTNFRLRSDEGEVLLRLVDDAIANRRRN
ncbi:MAG TPA: EVE domain-containing protein [Planctomycetaceae bacterium]|jgi:hypothetical protein|nr:EVE domain-containing protein [Planctomycetaceae bacterium]